MKDIISFNSFQPFLGRHLKIAAQKFSVYYIYDDFSGVPYFKGFSERDEKEFIKNTDLIIVSSSELKSRRTHINTPIEVVNNGVHFDAFNVYADRKRVDEKYAMTVGYTGTVDARLNISLLEQVVSELSDTRFLFIGKIMDHAVFQRLSKYTNVCFEPPVPADQIPRLQSHIDIGIIPYVCNALTAAIYPLKVNEYLAMGLPVVMTPFASVGDADELVCRANDPKGFKHSIQTAFGGNDERAKHARIEIARKADWHMRAEQLMDFIRMHRNEKKEIHQLNHKTCK